MAVDISNMNARELESLKKKIDKRLEKLANDDRKAALEAAEKAARDHGFSLADLAGMGGAKKRGAPKKVNPPKYRNPDNPDQTWTGKGRRPDWIRAAQDKDEDLSKFEI